MCSHSRGGLSLTGQRSNVSNRSKINELKAECQKMNKEFEEVQSESQTFLSYEKKAETLANEIKGLQGELGDYNTVSQTCVTCCFIRVVLKF